jgi:hypothetical protein
MGCKQKERVKGSRKTREISGEGSCPYEMETKYEVLAFKCVTIYLHLFNADQVLLLSKRNKLSA